MDIYRKAIGGLNNIMQFKKRNTSQAVFNYNKFSYGNDVDAVFVYNGISYKVVNPLTQLNHDISSYLVPDFSYQQNILGKALVSANNSSTVTLFDILLEKELTGPTFLYRAANESFKV